MNAGAQEALVPAESRCVTADTVSTQHCRRPPAEGAVLSCITDVCCHSSFCRVLQASRATKDRPVHRSVSHHRASLPHQENLEAARRFALRITSACVCVLVHVYVCRVSKETVGHQEPSVPKENRYLECKNQSIVFFQC